MRPILFAILLFAIATMTSAQSDTTKMKVVKSDPVEMKYLLSLSKTSLNLPPAVITGDFTVSCAHPACGKGKTAEERAACTAMEVLKEIKAHLKVEPPAYLDQVNVDFDVDIYGYVKTIRANCGTAPELGKAVIIALYGLPQFIAAQKDGTRAASHCTFSYASSDLFTKP